MFVRKARRYPHRRSRARRCRSRASAGWARPVASRGAVDPQLGSRHPPRGGCLDSLLQTEFADRRRFLRLTFLAWAAGRLSLAEKLFPIGLELYTVRTI